MAMTPSEGTPPLDATGRDASIFGSATRPSLLTCTHCGSDRKTLWTYDTARLCYVCMYWVVAANQRLAYQHQQKRDYRRRLKLNG
jgi:hypothetical protein